jgi:hypothetical protein
MGEHNSCSFDRQRPERAERRIQRKQTTARHFSALVKSAGSSLNILSSNGSIVHTQPITLGKDKASGSRQSTDRGRHQG